MIINVNEYLLLFFNFCQVCILGYCSISSFQLKLSVTMYKLLSAETVYFECCIFVFNISYLFLISSQYLELLQLHVKKNDHNGPNQICYSA